MFMKKGFFGLKKNRRGAILMESVVFIILNLVFLMILILFLFKQGQGAIVYEQTYAKQIALLIDSGKPGMTMVLDMKKAKNLADNNKIDFEDVVKIEGNSVVVKLSGEGGYSYDFFNDVDVSLYPKTDSEEIKDYVLVINGYNKNVN